MIEAMALGKRYGTHQALDGVSFSVPKGQIVGLLGQNGAGKTTLLNIMTGCLAPSSGSVTIGGHDVLLSPRRAKMLIGYLPEQAPLYDEMTVASYLRFACELKCVAGESVSAHISEVARLAGVAEMLPRRIGNLSRGYRQRVGLAQALCGAPEVVFLDEPTSGLDPAQSREFCELVKSLNSRATVFFSSHILGEVQAVCDRTLILHKGKLILDSAQTRDQSRVIRLRASILMPPKQLLPSLRTLDGVLRVEQEASEREDVTVVTLTAQSDSAPECALFKLLSGLQAPLLRLTPVEDSLEDVFLRATREAS